MLLAIARFHYLSAIQLTRLLFSPGSLTYVRRHVMELFHGGYLRRVFLPTITPMGSSRAIYCLDAKGYRYLKPRGLAPHGRFRPDEDATREWLFLSHTLAANDVLIAAHLLSAQPIGVTIAHVTTERELKRSVVYVSDAAHRIGVAPDGWVDFRQGSRQTCLAFELDRGTVERKAVQRKVRAYLHYTQGPYQEAFGTRSLTVVFITTAGERRLTELLTWSEAALAAEAAQTRADLFRFAALDAASIPPVDLFFGPRFLRPFDPHPLPLLAASNDAT
jgi:hypothetical protein